MLRALSATRKVFRGVVTGSPEYPAAGSLPARRGWCSPASGPDRAGAGAAGCDTRTARRAGRVPRRPGPAPTAASRRCRSAAAAPTVTSLRAKPRQRLSASAPQRRAPAPAPAAVPATAPAPTDRPPTANTRERLQTPPNPSAPRRDLRGAGPPAALWRCSRARARPAGSKARPARPTPPWAPPSSRYARRAPAWAAPSGRAGGESRGPDQVTPRGCVMARGLALVHYIPKCYKREGK